jgi:tetratricopeptide (TPR) repeat protein
MIICSQCGSAVEDSMVFCSECGTSVPKSGTLPPKPTISGATGAAPAPYLEPLPFNAPPPYSTPTNTLPINAPPPFMPPASARQPEAIHVGARSEAAPNSTKALIALISIVAVAAIGVAIYFAVGSSPASRMATAMKNAVTTNQIVNTSNNDAYFYYQELKKIDPTHKALNEVGQQVLSQLRGIGDDIFRRKVLTNSEKVSDQDWMKGLRACEWAHDIVPGDKQIEARWRFASGEVAKSQKRMDEAERGFTAAAQVDSSWVLPQNSLGLLRSENRHWREAIPYYERAINLKPDWEIPYNNMGTAYYYLKELDTAQYWYQRATQLNPNWARPHFWLGQIYEQRKWKAQAIEAYQKALQLDTNNYSLTPNEEELIRKNLAKLQQ